MIDDLIFSKGIKDLESAMRTKALSAESLGIYYSQIKFWNIQKWQWVVNQIIRQTDKFPAIKDILKFGYSYSEEIRPEDRKENLWLCWLCNFQTSGEIRQCKLPMSESQYMKFVNSVIGNYGSRNWAGKPVVLGCNGHDIDLSLFESELGDLGFKMSPPVEEHLKWRKSKQLNTGPYFEKSCTT